MTRDFDPDGRRLPIKLDSTSNGEFAPIPLDRSLIRANRLASDKAGECARRLGMGRRDFLMSSCGAASTLIAFNAAHAAAGRTGGFFQLSPEAALEPELAAAELGKREFIFDVQGHFVNPDGAWLNGVPAAARPFSTFEGAQCALADAPGDRAYLQCLGPDAFIKDVFLDSDTDIMVLSFVPSTREGEPLTIEKRSPRGLSWSGWRAASGCCSTAGSIPTSLATSKIWSGLPPSASPPSKPTPSGDRTAKAFG